MLVRPENMGSHMRWEHTAPAMSVCGYVHNDTLFKAINMYNKALSLVYGRLSYLARSTVKGYESANTTIGSPFYSESVDVLSKFYYNTEFQPSLTMAHMYFSQFKYRYWAIRIVIGNQSKLIKEDGSKLPPAQWRSFLQDVTSKFSTDPELSFYSLNLKTFSGMFSQTNNKVIFDVCPALPDADFDLSPLNMYCLMKSNNILPKFFVLDNTEKEGLVGVSLVYPFSESSRKHINEAWELYSTCDDPGNSVHFQWEPKDNLRVHL